MLDVSMIGCGNIAHIIAQHPTDARIVAVYDMDPRMASDLSSSTGARMCDSVEELLSVPSDLVIEAASPNAVSEVGVKALESGKDLMIMSVGGLSDDGFRKELIYRAERLKRNVYIPSGAIGGLDALSSANVGRIDEVLLETTKPPKSLGLGVDKRTLVFDGTPSEAIKRFPKNVNVSVTLSVIAGNEKVRVRVFADPKAQRNVHKITIRGEVGELTFVFDNVPSPNMSTSLLAGYSAVALLRKINSPFKY